jgi:hypothetical protein
MQATQAVGLLPCMDRERRPAGAAEQARDLAGRRGGSGRSDVPGDRCEGRAVIGLGVTAAKPGTCSATSARPGAGLRRLSSLTGCTKPKGKRHSLPELHHREARCSVGVFD